MNLAKLPLSRRVIHSSSLVGVPLPSRRIDTGLRGSVEVGY